MKSLLCFGLCTMCCVLAILEGFDASQAVRVDTDELTAHRGGDEDPFPGYAIPAGPGCGECIQHPGSPSIWIKCEDLPGSPADCMYYEYAFLCCQNGTAGCAGITEWWASGYCYTKLGFTESCVGLQEESTATEVSCP